MVVGGPRTTGRERQNGLLGVFRNEESSLGAIREEAACYREVIDRYSSGLRPIALLPISRAQIVPTPS